MKEIQLIRLWIIIHGLHMLSRVEVRGGSSVVELTATPAIYRGD